MGIIARVKFVAGQSDTKIFAASVLLGAIIQFLCRLYIKKHPELFEQLEQEKKRRKKQKERNKINKNRKKRPYISRIPRGGDLGTSLYTLAMLVQWLSSNGVFLTPVAISLCMKAANVSKYALTKYIREASVQNLTHLEKKNFASITIDNNDMDHCPENLLYLFNVISDPSVPYEQKHEVAAKTLVRFLNIKNLTNAERIKLLLCIVSLLIQLANLNNWGSYRIILENLIEALKNGTISKPLLRLIIARLRRKGLPVDPELLRLVEVNS